MPLQAGKIYCLSGDLEDYLSISKDLSNVIDFCQNKFNEWVDKNSNGKASKVAELQAIFEEIYQS